MNNLASMKNCPGVQGYLNWMAGYYLLTKESIQITVIGDECLWKFECKYATELD